MIATQSERTLKRRLTAAVNDADYSMTRDNLLQKSIGNRSPYVRLERSNRMPLNPLRSETKLD
jgi:hypothetical protein